MPISSLENVPILEAWRAVFCAAWDATNDAQEAMRMADEIVPGEKTPPAKRLEWFAPISGKADFSYGHYLTIIGCIGSPPAQIVCQDSSADNVVKSGSDSDQAPGRVIIEADKFLACWHDKDINDVPYIRYGITVGPGAERFCGGKGGKPGPCPVKGPEAKQPPEPKEARVPEQQPSEKAQRAKAAHKLTDKEVQRYSEEHNEPQLAQQLGGVSLPDSEPADVVLAGNPADQKAWAGEAARWRAEKAAGKNPPGKMDISGDMRHAVELKTVTDNANGKLTMDSYAQVRKIVMERERGATMHTIVFDDSRVKDALGPGQHDESQRRILYRRGIAGSARLGNLFHAKDMEEIKDLMARPEKDLPPGAERSDRKLRVGRWRPFKDDQGKGFKNQTTGVIVRAKK